MPVDGLSFQKESVMRFAKVTVMGLMAVALASFAVAQGPAPASTSILVPKDALQGLRADDGHRTVQGPRCGPDFRET